MEDNHDDLTSEWLKKADIRGFRKKNKLKNTLKKIDENH